MAAAIGAMVWQRRPRLAKLKLEGLPRVALWHTILIESLILLATGCLTGAVYGLYGQQLADHALAQTINFPITYSIAPLTALLGLALVIAAALATLAIPGYLAASVPATPRACRTDALVDAPTNAMTRRTSAALVVARALAAMHAMLVYTGLIAAATARRPLQEGGARAESEQRTRDALLDAADEELARDGLSHASLESVAAKAGVTKQTLLRHFGSKEGLIEATIRRASKLVRPKAPRRPSATCRERCAT